MCLDLLSKFNVELNEAGEGIGYKVFHPAKSGGVYCLFYSERKKRPINIWMKSKPERTGYGGQGSYVAGFHFFKTKKDAQGYMRGRYWLVIRKIKFRGILATGMWARRKCIVAKEIMILENE